MIHFGGMLRASRQFVHDVVRADWVRRVAVVSEEQPVCVHYFVGIGEPPDASAEMLDVDELLRVWREETSGS